MANGRSNDELRSDSYLRQTRSRKDAYDMLAFNSKNGWYTPAEQTRIRNYIKKQPASVWTNKTRGSAAPKFKPDGRTPIGKRVVRNTTPGPKKQVGLSPKEFRNGMALFMGKGLSKADAYRKMKYYTGSPEQVHKFRKYRASENGLSNGAFMGGMAKLMKKGDSKQTAYKKMTDIAKVNRNK